MTEENFGCGRGYACALLYSCEPDRLSEDPYQDKIFLEARARVYLKARTVETEMRAIEVGLQLLSKYKNSFREAVIFSDSETAVMLARGDYKASADNMVMAGKSIRGIVKTLGSVLKIRFAWLPREHNKPADRLAAAIKRIDNGTYDS
jgi:ribonuclease HI